MIRIDADAVSDTTEDEESYRCWYKKNFDRLSLTTGRSNNDEVIKGKCHPELVEG